ncbi:MAG: 16S rRNA (cytosine(1402)-N(4))-methyltransferase RsmH [Anaerolineaceae bacterium]|nr:16S rRNA (cytosine(1402)-N(4))-methyltransferase RsmH [Anaerolineaceae bacterium]
MNASEHGGGAVAGNPGGHFPHQPVLYQEVLGALAPQTGKSYLDGTVGAGGHAEGILKASAPQGRLLGLDLDPEALAITRQRLFAFQDRVILHQASYRDAAAVLEEIGWGPVDGILLDLGVSSMQLDRPNRGFSFRESGPLDMRFNPSGGTSAADLVNLLDEKSLADLIYEFGEERYSRRIARAIVSARPFQTTGELAAVIEKAVPAGYDPHIHPATRTFQALRIGTNRELETISQALPALTECLAPGGKIAVISFHSLEDRLTKQFFKQESKDCICPPSQPICTCGHKATLKVLTRKPISATEEEMRRNPRSRSAKLRVAERI